MTLEDLQVKITGDMDPLLRQLLSLQSRIQPVADKVAGVAKTATQATQQAAEKMQKVAQSTGKAEQEAANVTQKANKQRRQSLEEIAAIAERAAKRYNSSVQSMGNGGPLHEPVVLSGNSGTATGSKKVEETAAPTGNTENALMRLQSRIQQTRQKFAQMFGTAKTEAPEAAAATQELVTKLDIINAKADIQRRKLAQLEAEYGSIASSAGGTGSDAALKLQEHIINTQARLQALTAQSDEAAAAIRNLDAGLSETGKAGGKAAQGAERAGSAFKSTSNKAGGFERALSRIQNQIFRNLIVYGLLIKGLTSLGSYMWSALKTNTAFSNSLNNLKVQFLTAFQPIYQACLPALTSLINAMAKAMAYIAAFISGFFGKTYKQSEQSAAALNKNVKALDATGKAAKAAKKELAGFDQLNVLASTTSATAAPDTGKDASLANTNFSSPSAKPLISEAQIKAAEAAGERVRKVWDKIYGFCKKYATPIKAIIAGVVGAFLMFKLISFVSNIIRPIGVALAAIASPAGIATFALAAFVAGLVYLYNTNKKFRSECAQAWTAIRQAVSTAWTVVIQPVLKNIQKLAIDMWDKHLKPMYFEFVKFVGQIAKDLTPLIKTYGPAIKDSINSTTSLAARTIDNVIDTIKNLMKFLGGLADFLTGVFTGNWKKAYKGLQETNDAFFGKDGELKDTAKNALDYVNDLFPGSKKAFMSAWDGITKWWDGLWKQIKGGFKSFINSIIDGLNTIIGGIDKIPHIKLPKTILGGVTIGLSIPKIPHLATGGIVSNPTILEAGEGGESEAIAPLSKLSEMISNAVQNSHSSDSTLHLTVILDGKKTYETVKKYAKRDNHGSNRLVLDAT